MILYFRTRIFLIALFLVMAEFSSATELNKSLGTLKDHRFDRGIFTGRTSYGQFRIIVYSPTIFRVEITQQAAFEDFSYAVVATPLSTKSVLKENRSDFVLSTDSLELTISKSPVRFILKDKSGNVINEDDEAFGTSWLGDEVSTYKKLQDGERFIGLGEKTGNLDRRGQAYTNWNTDYFAYPSTADALYVTTPFYIGLHHRSAYGIFLDNAGRTQFNFGASNNRFSSFTASDGEMNYYLISHASVKKIIESYTWLTGRMEMPPLWSLGLQQSRYSYYPESEVLNLAATFREKKIPADVIYLDIHYMDRFKIFTWDEERFPNPARMTAALKAQGFHLAVILDPGIKVEKNYPAYEEGIRQDVFVKYPDGSNYTAEVWPGWCHFPDFTKATVRTWWGSQFKSYVDNGVEGFWNDMNEPATWGQSTPNLIEFDFDGHKKNHRAARNVYGFNMTRSTYEGTKKILNGKRPFLLTRSGYSGIQRYSAVWTGDNVASDEHMLLGLRMMMSMGIAGIPITGMDVGGFTGGGSDKLFARWVSIGAFSPFFRIHANANTRDQEPWSFGEQCETTVKSYVNFRYRLLPYLYSAFHESSVDGVPITRTLAIDHAFDSRVYDPKYQHQFFCSSSIMVAPGESTKEFYKVLLPEGGWFDLYTDKVYGGDEEIVSEAGVDHLPLFVKRGSLLPMQSLVQHVGQAPEPTLDLHVYSGNQPNEFHYYEDDGTTYDYQTGKYFMQTIVYNPHLRTLTFNIPSGSMSSKFKNVRLILHGFGDEVKSIKLAGKEVPVKNEKVAMIGNYTIDAKTVVVEDVLKGETVTW